MSSKPAFLTNRALCALTLAFAVGLAACGKDQDFLYYFPKKEPDQNYRAKIKEIQGAGGVDVVWIIDNSGSMAQHQKNVMMNAELFMREFTQQRVSWKMGLLSTDSGASPYLGFKSAFDSKTPDPITVFQSAVASLGTSGSPTERTFDPIIQSLQGFPKFLRPNLPTAFILVTDAREQSTRNYAQFKSDLAALNGGRDIYVYSVLAATDLGAAYCTPDESSYQYAGGPYEMYAKYAKESMA